jgi:hypothetical protein
LSARAAAPTGRLAATGAADATGHLRDRTGIIAGGRYRIGARSCRAAITRTDDTRT